MEAKHVKAARWADQIVRYGKLLAAHERKAMKEDRDEGQVSKARGRRKSSHAS
jgi:hypothetical protein